MRRFPIRWKHVAVVVGLIILAALIVDFNRRTDELNRLTAQLERVQAEGTAVMQTQEALVTSLAYASSTEAVEDWAYSGSHWVRVGEHPIRIVPAGDVTPSPTPAVDPQAEQYPPWFVWWELFFGD